MRCHVANISGPRGVNHAWAWINGGKSLSFRPTFVIYYNFSKPNADERTKGPAVVVVGEEDVNIVN